MKNPSDEFDIVLGSKFHLQPICDIENQIFKEADRFSKSRLSYLLSSANAAFFVCLRDEVCIGYGIALRNKLRNGRVKGRIYSLGVIPKWRNKGVGTLLLKYLENWLVNVGSSFITLETRKGQSGAKGYFERTGYTVSEILPNYYESVDGLRMKKVEPFLSRRSNK